jgi:type IV fimbrial biogenesis protein FimT
VVINRSDKRAFTLIELIIVLAIMGIVAAIAAPNFTVYMANSRLNGAARMVMSDLMHARQQAVTQNNSFRVIFSGNHQYTILDDDNGNGSADTGEATEPRDILTDYHDVTFSVSSNPVFYPRGTALGTTVTLTSSKTGDSRYVKAASTGRVKIDLTP